MQLQLQRHWLAPPTTKKKRVIARQPVLHHPWSVVLVPVCMHHLQTEVHLVATMGSAEGEVRALAFRRERRQL